MTDIVESIVNMGKGIGNDNRYRILQILMRGPASVGSIVDQVDLSQPAVSQHLKILKSLDIIESKRIANEIHYSVNSDYVLGLLKTISAGVHKCKSNKDC